MKSYIKRTVIFYRRVHTNHDGEPPGNNNDDMFDLDTNPSLARPLPSRSWLWPPLPH